MTKKKEVNKVPDVKTLMKDPKFQEEFSKLVEKYAGGSEPDFEIEGRYLVVNGVLREYDEDGAFFQGDLCEDAGDISSMIVLQRYLKINDYHKIDEFERKLLDMHDEEELSGVCQVIMYEAEQAMWEKKATEETAGTVLSLRVSFRFVTDDEVEEVKRTCCVYSDVFDLEDAVSQHIEDYDDKDEAEL